MKHQLLIAAAATAMMAMPSLASAQDSGVYIKAQAGYGVVNDADVIAAPGSTSSLQGDVAGQGNLGLGAGIGYDFGNNWRIELDGSALYNDLGTLGGQPNSAAKLRVNTGMLNAIYDFSDFGSWEPYVGAGIGIASGDVSLSASDFLNDTATVLVNNPACVSTITAGTARHCSVDDSEANFAWNLMAGLGYKITDNLTWDTNYRYVDMGDFTVNGELDSASFGATPVASALGSTVENVSAHMLMTGFRYRFGKSAPEPIVVAPAPVIPTYTCWDNVTEVTSLSLCPAQTYTCWDGSTEVTDLALCPAQVTYYTCDDGVTSVTDLAACPVIRNTCDEQFRQELIYYEFDKGQSAETRNTINRILDVGQFCSISSVRVVGHTDTSGSAAYNMGLSQRRASDAQAELVRQGVSSGMVFSEGKGETEPFVQTGNGVREQLNRRTEVLITLSEVGTAMMSN